MRKTHTKKWRLATAGLVLAVTAAAGFGPAAQAEQVERRFGQEIEVYKTPTCGCCKNWVTHLKRNGFKVTAHDLASLDAIKAQYGVHPQLQSCHTAVVDGYVVEGHVPADDIWRLLSERPAVTGITVPGMPVGSPGMEQGGYTQPYDVLIFDAAGRTSVFSRY